MSAIRLAVSALAFCILGMGQNSARLISSSRVYFLRDDTLHQWCAYTNEKRWITSYQSGPAYVHGELEYSDGRISRIYIREESDTGDWVLDEEYDLNRAGELVAMSRVIGRLSEREIKRESYKLYDGKAKLVSSSASSLETNEGLPLPRPLDAYERWPIFYRITDFPFAALLAKLSNGLNAERLCVPSVEP